VNRMEGAATQPAPADRGLGIFCFGGDYNPEQWTTAFGYDGESVWQEDLRLMRLASVNTATVGVFSWVSLQPAEHTFTFEWLDRVMDLLAGQGVRVILGTGTAAQPAWLSASYPDVLPVDRQGRRQSHGRRQNYCPTSPDFRRLAGGLAQKLAERYGAHPALLLWHVSNEYGPWCACSRCAERFREWLRARHGDLDALNRHWVTAFWSHTYTDWPQVSPPTVLGESNLQGLALDYQRFMSDMNLECYLNEADLLRRLTPGVPITTNFMGGRDGTSITTPHKGLDYASWAPHVDVVSWDSYPRRGDHPSVTAFIHDVMRGLKGGRPWLLMEQTPNQIQWAPHNPLKRPDVMRLQSYQAVAHGSDGVLFFQWRQSRGSAEKYHGAIVSHAGHEHTRTFREVSGLGAECKTLGDVWLGTRVPARVAIVFSWPNWWNVEYLPGPSSSLRYGEEVQAYYRALWDRNVAVDVVSPDADLSRYDLVLTPMLNMVTAEQGTALERYVLGGGVLLTTYFSGLVDEFDRAWLGGYPGPLRRALGIWVEEYDPLYPDQTNRLVVGEPGLLPVGETVCDLWCEVVHLEGATACAVFADDFYAGRPAITENRLGAGRAYYVATRPSAVLVGNLVGGILDSLSIASPLVAPPNVEITRRVGGSHTFTFILNHRGAATQVALPEPMRDLLTDHLHTSSLALEVNGVAVLVPASYPN
jgi:beta-galactosidase